MWALGMPLRLCDFGYELIGLGRKVRVRENGFQQEILYQSEHGSEILYKSDPGAVQLRRAEFSRTVGIRPIPEHALNLRPNSGEVI